MEYIPFGSDSKIKLTVKIVQDLICIPTSKTRQVCSERDALRFMMLCQARALNPFEGDCYLQGYDGKNGPEFSLITAHQCFLKRSEASPEFQGMLSGVRVQLKSEKVIQFKGEYFSHGEEIVVNGHPITLSEGTIIDRLGDFYDRDTEEVVGAWAMVFFEKKKVPTFRALRLAAFRKPYGVWETNPEGMIVKCAEADALRSSFPTKLGGLYAPGEIQTEEERFAAAKPARSAQNAFLPAPQSDPADFSPQEHEAVVNRDEPATATEQAAPGKSPQLQLLELIRSAGFSFEELKEFGVAMGHFTDAPDTYKVIDDVPADVAKRLLRAQKGLLDGLKKQKEGQ